MTTNSTSNFFLGWGLALELAWGGAWLEGVLWAGLRAAGPPRCTCLLLSAMTCTCGLLSADKERVQLSSPFLTCGPQFAPCVSSVSELWARWGGRIGARTGKGWCVCVLGWGGGGVGEGAREGGGVRTYLALCPGSASPHRFQSGPVGSQHSDVFPGRFLRQVAPQAGSSDEPLILLI